MALIKTVAEIRNVIPRMSNLSDTANLPNLDKAGRKHIMPILGKALYDALNEVYNQGEPSEMQSNLIKEIQLPLAAFAMIDDMAFMHTSITDNGIRTAQTNNFQAAHRWEYLELKNTLMDYATDGIELLLAWLYDNKNDWPEWLDSDAYKEINSLLIKTGTDFKNYYPLFQPLRTYWSIRPIIRNVEENYISKAFGRELFKWIKSQEEVIVTDDGEEIDVIWFLKTAIANLSVKHASEQMAVRFDQNGFTVLAGGGMVDDPNSQGQQTAAFQEKREKTEAANREGQNFLSKSCNYLVGIANGLYGDDWSSEFTTAFNNSPLKTDPNKKPYTNGNERRKIYRMP